MTEMIQPTENQQLNCQQPNPTIQSFQKHLKTLPGHLLKFNAQICEIIATAPISLVSSQLRQQNITKFDQFQMSKLALGAAISEKLRAILLLESSLNEKWNGVLAEFVVDEIPKETRVLYEIIIHFFRSLKVNLSIYGIFQNGENSENSLKKAEISLLKAADGSEKILLEVCISLLKNTSHTSEILQKLTENDQKFNIFSSQFQSFSQFYSQGNADFAAKNYKEARANFSQAVNAILNFKTLQQFEPEQLDAEICLLFLCCTGFVSRPFLKLGLCHKSENGLENAVKFFYCAGFLGCSDAYLELMQVYESTPESAYEKENPESAKQQKLPKTPEIKEITRDSAEKAYQFIQKQSISLDQFAKKIKISTSEIPTDPQHRSCYFCVLSFFVQQNQVKKEKFDGKFCEKVLESFLNSHTKGHAASSSRLLTLVMSNEATIFRRKAQLIVEKCNEFLDKQETFCLMLRIMQLIVQGDKDYAVYENFVQNYKSAK